MNTSSRTKIITLSDGWTMRQAPGTIRWALYDQNGVFSHMLSVNMDAIVTSAFKAGQEFERAEQATKPSIGPSLLKQPGPMATKCYCKPGKCAAPKIMGRQTPCLDPERAGMKPQEPARG